MVLGDEEKLLGISLCLNCIYLSKVREFSSSHWSPYHELFYFLIPSIFSSANESGWAHSNWCSTSNSLALRKKKKRTKEHPAAASVNSDLDSPQEWCLVLCHLDWPWAAQTNHNFQCVCKGVSANEISICTGELSKLPSEMLGNTIKSLSPEQTRKWKGEFIPFYSCLPTSLVFFGLWTRLGFNPAGFPSSQIFRTGLELC